MPFKNDVRNIMKGWDAFNRSYNFLLYKYISVEVEQTTATDLSYRKIPIPNFKILNHNGIIF